MEQIKLDYTCECREGKKDKEALLNVASLKQAKKLCRAIIATIQYLQQILTCRTISS